jgi:hypothetical protein
VHDRRINGRAVVFGNQGWLYMRAMTWWDHDTGSIWSQPLGRAMAGPLRGVRLPLLPSALVPWASWRAENPDTLVLADDTGLGLGFRESPRDDFVIGITLGEHARAYRYPDVARVGVINDAVGPYPVLVYANPSTRRVQTFLRTLGQRTLTFAPGEAGLVDAQTGSTWDPLRGIATAGPLRGQALRVLPHNSSFDWAWIDFYPHSTFYTPPGSGK